MNSLNPLLVDITARRYFHSWLIVVVLYSNHRAWFLWEQIREG